MIKKTFADLWESLGRKIALSPLLTPEKQTKKALARCRKRGSHQYYKGMCACAATLKP